MNTFKETIIRSFNRLQSEVKVKSPELLLGAGIVAIVGGAVWACVNTRKVDEVISKHAEAIDDIVKTREEIPEEEYTEKDARIDTAKTYLKTGLEFGKLYALPGLTMGLGIFCICKSHGIMSDRVGALATALTAQQGLFQKYRKRVIDELGPEADAKFKYNLHKEELPWDENDSGHDPNEMIVGEIEEQDIDKLWSTHTSTLCNENDPWFNLGVAKCNLANFQTRLGMGQTIVLNDVYAALGYPKNGTGAIYGWRPDYDNPLGKKIDFGLEKYEGTGLYDGAILTFNVDPEPLWIPKKVVKKASDGRKYDLKWYQKQYNGGIK